MDESNPILGILKKIPYFTELDDASYELIMNNITLEYYPPMHKLFSQGDAGDCMYIIKKGAVKIFQGNLEDKDEQTHIATLSDDSFFGEMALVSEATRNASALTLDESEIFVLKKEDFDNLIANNPSFAEQISTEFIQRVNDNDKNDEFKNTA